MKRNYNSNTAFLDLLFNTLIGFIALFAIAIIFMQPPAKQHDIQSLAEFIIFAVWPSEMSDDVDLYVEDPKGGLVFYGAKDSDFMHLDRDDMGNEVLSETQLNQEIVTIRSLVAGEFVVNVHLYGSSTGQTVPVTVNVQKIRPPITVCSELVELSSVGEEKTACRFELDRAGKVLNTWYAFKPLATPSWNW